MSFCFEKNIVGIYCEGGTLVCLVVISVGWVAEEGTEDRFIDMLFSKLSRKRTLVFAPGEYGYHVMVNLECNDTL